MNTTKEIDVQIFKENEQIKQLYEQIAQCQSRIEQLQKERKSVAEPEKEAFINAWLQKHFGIESQKAARSKSIFIIFNKNADFVQTVTTGCGEVFHYVSPVADKDTLEHWLRKNRLYAHRAASFCDRNREWYDLPFKEQLKSLCWEFDASGTLKSTDW